MGSVFKAYEKRIFALYGDMTRDRFCSPDGVILKFNEFLHDHLKSLGYEKLLFYSHHGLYFMDDASRNMVMGGDIPAPPVNKDISPLARLSPGGASLRKKTLQTAPSSSAGSGSYQLSYPNMSGTELVNNYIKRHVINENVKEKTALVFHTEHLETFFESPGTSEYFKGLLESDFRSFPASSHNIIIFVFGLNADALLDHIRNKPWNLLFSSDQGKLRKGIAFTMNIGPPGKDEINALVQHYRLVRGLSVEWLDYENILRILSAWLHEGDNGGLLALERWMEDLVQSGRVLDSDAVREKTAKEISKKSAMTRLMEMESMENVKDKINKELALAKDYLETKKMREKELVRKTCPDRLAVRDADQSVLYKELKHWALVGNPGTGKTTVARLMGEIYRDAGLLEVGHTIKCTRKDLVGQYVGETAVKTGHCIDSAMGGVLFVDEAYSLADGGENDFGREAVNEILEAMTSRKGQFVVILAGYPDKIKALIDSNHGFQRRVDTVLIEDYPAPVLERIFRRCCLDADIPVILDKDLDNALPVFFEELFYNRDENFGNAGTVKDEIFQKALANSQKQPDGSRIIRKTDFPPEYQKYFEERRADALEDLKKLIGLAGVKKRIQDLIILKSIEMKRAASNPDTSGKKNTEPGHYLFTGNPGTGKTTVARLMGEQFRQIGLLTKGHLVSVTASDLMGSVLGETEKKTKEYLEKALGGVLFVDEAHQLAAPHSFGRQAIDVIVPFISANKADFSVILAGYPDRINELLAMDPGLKRRFNERVFFEDYNASELADIFVYMAKEDGLDVAGDFMQGLYPVMQYMVQNKKSDFGNAGTVEKLLQKVKIRQAARLTRQGADHEEMHDLHLLTAEDLPSSDDIEGII